MSSLGPIMQILNIPFLFSLWVFFSCQSLAMLVQPVLAEARGTLCQEAWRGWSFEGFWGKAGVSELVLLVGTYMHQLEHGGLGFFGCPRYPAWASANMLLSWVKQSRGFSWCTETNLCDSSLCSGKQNP